MFRALRKHQKKILLILGVSLAIVWSSTGIISRLVTSPERAAGKIFGREVSRAEYESNARRWSAWLGPEMSRREAVWQRLILLNEAQRVGLEVSKAEERETIEAIITQGRPGVPFDEATYQFYLQAHRLRPEDFEETVHEAQLIQKLRRTITAAAIVTKSQVFERFKKENEKIKVKYVFLSTQDFLDEVEAPEEAEVLKFYEAHAQGKYRRPETVRVEYVAAFYDNLAQKVEVSQEEIENFYEQHKEDFKITPKPPEEEKLPLQPQPEDPENEAPEKESAQQPASTEEQPAAINKYRPLDEVAGEIEDKLRKPKARSLATKLIIAAANDLDAAQIPDFEATAKKHGLSFLSPDFFSRAQAPNLPFLGDSVGLDRGFADEVSLMLGGFKKGEDRISPIMTGSEGKFVFHIIGGKPPRTQALEEVRQEIIDELKSKQALKAAETQANSLFQKMQESSFEEVARAQGLKIEGGDFVSRRSASPFIKPAFDTEIGQTHKPFIHEDKVYLVKVEAREDADPTQFDKEKDILRFLVSLEEKERLYQEWLAHLRSRANLVDYRAEKEEKGKEEPAGA